MQTIAPGLTRHPAGYWTAPEETIPSYPSDGNEFCLSIEEKSFWFSHRNQMIAAAVRRYPPAAGPIFDVGAGNGYVAAMLQRSGFPTVAIEPNESGALNSISRGLPYVVRGSLPSTAFQPKTAGAIGLFDVLEHIEHDHHFLSQQRPYLKPGGRLYLTTPAYQWLWSGHDVRSGHYRRYSIEHLNDVVSAAGYRVAYATYMFWFLPPAVYTLRTLRSSGRATAPSVTSRSRSQHSAGGAILRRLAERCLAFEVRRVDRGATIPFGGSCLLVASVAE
jgi:SAM-dependent methyltransferase